MYIMVNDCECYSMEHRQGNHFDVKSARALGRAAFDDRSDATRAFGVTTTGFYSLEYYFLRWLASRMWRARRRNRDRREERR